jgi:hypothetical protein
MKNVVAIAFVLAVTAISGAAQDPNRANPQTNATDAKAILKQVAETYKNLRSYHFEGKYTLEQVTESIQWEFKPAEVSGAPVRMQGVLVFSFALQ